MAFEKVTIGPHTLYKGDCLEVLESISSNSVDAVVTSPPYAEQRKSLYGGIPEHRYPLWTANWLIAAENALTNKASVLINIREHIANGEISDYVHKTRMLLRSVGFVECEEIIWIKPDSPPVGSINRPRRSWERVLWFGKSKDAFCDTKANGSESDRLGLEPTIASAAWVNGFTEDYGKGISRHRDYVSVGTGKNEPGIDHPAKYPNQFAEWLVKGWSEVGGTVIDPFLGSGTTLIACHRLGRVGIGIEKEQKYFDLSCQRLEAEIKQASLLEEVA